MPVSTHSKKFSGLLLENIDTTTLPHTLNCQSNIYKALSLYLSFLHGENIIK